MTTAPKANPPTCAKNATPPPFASGDSRPQFASTSWYTNQPPRKTYAGIFTTHTTTQVEDARRRVQHEVGAEHAAIAPLAPRFGT